MARTKRSATGKASSSKKKRKLSRGICRERPKKYKKWSDVSMVGALKAVTEGMAVNRAATEYNVPKTTLLDRVAGRVQHGTRPGRVPFLSYFEEEELVNYLVTCSKVGYPKTRDDVIGIVRKTLQKKGDDPIDIVGKGWWARFMQRWPKLSLRKGDGLAQARATAVNGESIHEYYSLLEETLKKHGVFNCASRIYNMDESGMPLDPKLRKVVALRGAKKVHCHTSGNKAQITILACANAAGNVIPPMVIFEGKRLNPEWTKGEVPDTLYGMSEKGWTDMELFGFWMKDLFLTHIPPARPVILLLDGHSSHYEPDTIRFAAEKGVVVLCLPPHTTHVSQPLDVSFFAPLKTYWLQAIHQYCQDNPGRVVTKYQFSSLFSTAWYKAIKPENLVAGFRKVGVCPFNANAIKAPDLSSSTIMLDQCDGEDRSDQESGDEEVPLPELNSEICTSEFDRTNPSKITEEEKLTFTVEQLQLFQTRYENGYNLFLDASYVQWLQLYHPSELPDCNDKEEASSEMDFNERSDPFGPFLTEPESPTVDMPTIDETALTMATSPSISPVISAASTKPSSSPCLSLPCMAVSPTAITPLSPRSSTIGGSESGVRPSVTSPLVSCTPAMSTPSSPSAASAAPPLPTSSTSPSSKPLGNRKPLSPISQFLTIPTVSFKSQVCSVSRARVLTSAEAMSLMEAKKKMKQKEMEVKEARKKERAEKKQQREEEAKRKAEEKERKATERKKAQAEKEAERKRKTEAREAKRKSLNLQKRPLRSRNKENIPVSGEANLNTATDKGDQSECGVCLGRYEDDLINGVLQKEWVRCTNTISCGLWMHRDCLSMEGKSYVCYICNVIFD